MRTNYPAACSGGLAPREHRIEAGGMQWHTLEWGERGRPMALWHGVRSSAENWWRVGPLLAGLGFHVWAPDLPGHGMSDDSPLGYAVDATATLLDAWLARLELRDPVVAGHSWGGLNALAHALLPVAEVRQRALVLVDPPLQLPRDTEPFIPDFIAGVGEPATDEATAAFTAAQPRWHGCDVVITLRALEQARSAAIGAFFRDNAGIKLAAELGALPIPALMILGDPAFGGLWSAEQVGEVRHEAPDIAIDILAEASHNPYRDEFVPFSMSLGNFVKRFV